MSHETLNHVSVLIKESIELLKINPNGIYLDCTFGRGGHSQKILEHLGSQGRLIAIDKDQEAINAAKKIKDPRFEIFQTNFLNFDEILKKKSIEKLDGILMDLGVSSPQIDNPIRGFSFKQDGELDMRMDQSQNLTAHYIVNNFDEKELAFIFKEYGEERFSKKISRSIVEYRENHKPIDTTLELSKIISQSVPKKDPNKDPATRVFQALRIRVNDELNDLQECLPKAFDYLKDNGRLAIISFHSLEDRIVKNFVKSKLKTDLIPKNIPIKASDIQKPEIMMIGKVIEPSDLEVKHNPRARSAKLRVIERLANS